jgi:hypothetical protein
MSNWKTRTVAAAAIMAGVGLGITAIATAAPTPTPTPTPAVTASTAVDAAVAKQLTYLREEERLARDVYTALYELYPDATSFSRIANAEQRHFDSMGLMLSRHGLADPSSGLSAGTYANDTLTKLSAQLMTQAKVSVNEAYKVGVAIEQTDIADLKTGLAGNVPADVKAAYTYLQVGSDNHLASFTALRDGKTLGLGNGTGMQNGRRGNGAQANPSNTTAPGTGMGPGMGAGRNAANGAGQGAGRSGTWTRPANCPLG